jgi:hypothetical protein
MLPRRGRACRGVEACSAKTARKPLSLRISVQPAPPGVQPAVRGTLPVLPALHSQLFTQPFGISAARSPAGLAAYLAARPTSSSAVSRTLKGNKECQLQRFFCNIILEARTKLLFPGTKLPACTTLFVTGSSVLTDQHTSRP